MTQVLFENCHKSKSDTPDGREHWICGVDKVCPPPPKCPPPYGPHNGPPKVMAPLLSHLFKF